MTRSSPQLFTASFAVIAGDGYEQSEEAKCKEKGRCRYGEAFIEACE